MAAWFGAVGANAQTPKTVAPAASPRASAPATPPAIEPAAALAVARMGEYIKSLPAFSIQAETSTDEVLVAGPKVQYGGALNLTYGSPDRLWMRVVRDEEDDQQFFYDGSTLSLWIEAKKTWASSPASGTVADAIAMVEAKYDVSFPLGDLLSRAVRKDLLKNVEAGILVGSGRVGGVDCDHLGFHQAGADWQLWIEKGDRPLPRKLVITTLDEPTQPQHEIVMTWNLSPKLDTTRFTFVAPEGAERIVIAERSTAPKPAIAPKKEVK